jgi:hypothetical protein
MVDDGKTASDSGNAHNRCGIWDGRFAAPDPAVEPKRMDFGDESWGGDSIQVLTRQPKTVISIPVNEKLENSWKYL